MSSFAKKLKLRCNIFRIPDNPEALMDDQGMYDPSFLPVSTNTPCFIMYLRLAAGKFQNKEDGQDSNNELICMLDTGTDVKDGDRIDCSSFYPYEFYVDSINPIVNARNGNEHHLECVLSLERKN